MSTAGKKNKINLSYEAKFIIILILIIIGVVLLYFAMEYTFEKVSPEYNATAITQPDNQKATVIKE